MGVGRIVMSPHETWYRIVLVMVGTLALLRRAPDCIR
jgi:hypothetical protein